MGGLIGEIDMETKEQLLGNVRATAKDGDKNNKCRVIHWNAINAAKIAGATNDELVRAIDDGREDELSPSKNP